MSQTTDCNKLQNGNYFFKNLETNVQWFIQSITLNVPNTCHLTAEK